MSTRFYLSSTAAPLGGITPGYEAGWTTASNVRRNEMHPVRDNSAQVTPTLWVGTGAPGANASDLLVQFVSRPLAGGIGFTTSQTAKGYMHVAEANASCNVNRQPICLKVVNGAGVIQATLLPLGHYGPTTTEWNVSTLNAKALADGDALQANYTTVARDRLVLEVGGQVDATGGVEFGGGMNWGSSAGVDLPEVEGTAGFYDSWFEVSADLSFTDLPVPGDDNPGCLFTLVQRLTGGEALF